MNLINNVIIFLKKEKILFFENLKSFFNLKYQFYFYKFNRMYGFDSEYQFMFIDYIYTVIGEFPRPDKIYIKHRDFNLFTKFLKFIDFPWRLIKYVKVYATFISILKKKCLFYINILIYNMKWILLSFVIAIFYFFISLFYIQIDFSKQIALWFITLITYYLLISTFNSFLNKYKYGKFTSAIQRFWKRTSIIFWLIEGFLFLLFFYYFLNSSQEPLYMFDYSNLNQEHLIQLKTSYKNLILLSLGIYLGFILLININFYIFSQQILILSLISLIIFYTLYIESYQFVYIINLFASKEWIFDDIEQIWILDIEENNLRVKQQYFILCLIAKYWHFIFIFISWFFFLIKSLELNKTSITLLGYNIQNLLILYILNLLCLIQWIKIMFKKFLEITYYWFFTQYDEKFFINFFIELWNILKNYFTLNYNIINNLNLTNFSNILYFSNELSCWKYIINCIL